MSNGSSAGSVWGLVFFAGILLFLGIAFPFPVEWRWALSLIGITILFLLLAGTIWSQSWIVGLVCLGIAFVAGGFAVSFLSKAMLIQ
jgi:hypothetical protein